MSDWRGRRALPESGTIALAVLATLAITVLLASSGRILAQDWPAYGGDAGGQRHSAAAQINRDTARDLAPAWTFHTGETPRPGGNGTSFEDTPILADGKLLVCTPTDRVIALDPLTGHAEWVFDPRLPADFRPANGYVCRGVAVWHDATAAPGAACRARVVLTTLDARIMEVDLTTGKPCEGFGAHGAVALPTGRPLLYPGELTLDSPPAILRDTIIVGSAIDDMSRAQTPSSAVRALDARTGAVRWEFNPAPGQRAGGGNVWAPIAVDAARDLVVLPTASPSAAFWGGERPGEDLFASSVVALRGSTGALVWRFQTTHHDIWDYDVAAQPTLATVRRDGRDVPVVVVATKMGLVFVLDEETGHPVFPVTERPVPESDVPGERAAPTQPVPASPPPLVPQRLDPSDARGVTLIDRWLCRRRSRGCAPRGSTRPRACAGPSSSRSLAEA